MRGDDLFDKLFRTGRPGRRRTDWPFAILTAITTAVLMTHCSMRATDARDHLPQVKPAASTTGEIRHAPTLLGRDAADATIRTTLVNPHPAHAVKSGNCDAENNVHCRK